MSCSRSSPLLLILTSRPALTPFVVVQGELGRPSEKAVLLTDLIGILEQQQGVERVLAYVALQINSHIHIGSASYKSTYIHTLDQNEVSNTCPHPFTWA